MQTERLYYIDVLKSLAIIAVIVIHVSGSLFYMYSKIPLEWWMIGNIFDSSARWAVPVFFMCSGALLLKSREKISIFLKKRIPKILIPLLFWSLVYFIWNHKLSFDISKSDIIAEMKKIISGPNVPHLWFLYSILGLYLITPILSSFVNNSDKNTIKYFLIIGLIGTSIYPAFIKIFGFGIGIPLNNVSGYIGYFILGYFLVEYPAEIKWHKYLIYGFGLAGLFTTIFGTWLIAFRTGAPDQYFYNYFNIAVVSMSIAVFVFVRDVFINKKIFSKQFAVISKCSFGIYLVHMIILEVLAIVGISSTLLHPAFGIPFTVLCLFSLCLLLICVLKKIKYINITVP